jgi:hypothetical protein
MSPDPSFSSKTFSAHPALPLKPSPHTPSLTLCWGGWGGLRRIGARIRRECRGRIGRREAWATGQTVLPRAPSQNWQLKYNCEAHKTINIKKYAQKHIFYGSAAGKNPNLLNACGGSEAKHAKRLLRVSAQIPLAQAVT